MTVRLWELPTAVEIDPDLTLADRTWRAVLASRGITPGTPAWNAVVEPRLPDAAAAREQIGGLDRAVELLSAAIAGRQPIGVLTDSDLDGTASGVLLCEVLAEAGGHPVHAFIDGHERVFSSTNRDIFAGAGVRVVITADAGIADLDAPGIAREHGWTYIVTDHHTPLVNDTGKLDLPYTAAVVHPGHPHSPVDHHQLCGAGLAWLVGLALADTVGTSRAHDAVDASLELAALATIADWVPLTGWNRAIVREGLARLATSRRTGLQALGHALRKPLRWVSARDVGWSLAPVLKSRETHRRRAILDLLRRGITADVRALVDELVQERSARSAGVNDTFAAVAQDARASLAQGRLAVAAAPMRGGIARSVASRLANWLNRPVLLVNTAGVEAHGTIGGSLATSGRVDGVALIRACADLGAVGGGHPAAAYFEAPADQLDAIIERLRDLTRDIPADMLDHRLRIDSLLSPADLTDELVEVVRWFEPSGVGWERPVIGLLNVVAEDLQREGADQRRLRFRIAGTSVSCVAWQASEALEARLREGPADIAVELGEFPRGHLSLSLVDVRDLGEPEPPFEELPDAAVARLDDELLTWIEQREAHRISYGFVDQRLRLDEVLEQFQPSGSLLRAIGAAGLPAAVAEAIERLSEHADGYPPALVRWGDTSEPERCSVRSRSAEFVRILLYLRQRFVTDHSIEQSLALTDDLRYDVVPRLSPRRYIPPADVLMALDGPNDGFLEAPDLRAARDIVLRWLQERDYRFSGFQRDAFVTISRSAISRSGSGGEAGIIIGAGTGAGKTDAFFFPTLLRIIADRLSGARGTKVICIYPRTRLAEDHLSNTYLRAIAQLRELGVQLSLGIDYGSIPYQRTQFNDDGSKRRIWMAGWERVGNRWRARFATCPFDRPGGGRCNAPLFVGPTVDWRRPVYACCDDHGEIAFLRLTRADLCADPPDILLVTTESLNDHLSDTMFVPLFGEPGLDPERSLPPSIIMADEVHLHSGTKGVQIGYLLRRLIRRLRDADRDGNRRLTVIGLSATLAQPAAFFSDLTGVEQAQVEVVLPRATDRIRSGAEHIIFMRAQNVDRSQVLSTLIQAAMALLHVGVRPLPDQPERIFGFMNSLNVLHRWNLQMSDAEQRLQLWRLRLPSFVSGSRLIEEYAGPKPPCRDCEAAGHPDLGCPLYVRGECWWPMATGGLRNPAGIALSYAGGSENIAPTDQLVITTSANEVGIDDPQLQAVMQYTAPLDVAGFVQRRGRMGRQQGSRPTMITVLSPWSNLDTFYFQNHALLLEPDFRPPPLNMDNRVARRIHTFYALMDRLAWVARTEGRSFSATGLTPEVLRQLIDWTSSGEAWPHVAAWLADAIDAEVDDVIDLLRDGNDGVATRQLPLLARRAAERYMNDPRGYASRWGVSARDILPEFLPSRLFSELNLPELTLRAEGAPMPTETLQIEFGLREAMPGRVSYRRGAPYWIPIPRRPEAGADLPRVEIAEHYELLEQPVGVIPASSIPARVRNRIPPALLRDLTVYRPREARLVPFGGPALVNGRIRSVWRMLDDGRVDRVDRGDAAAKGSNANLLSDATNGSSIGFTRIRFDAELARPRYAETDSSKSHLQTLPGLFRSVTLGIADRDFDRGHHPIDALVATVGADVSLRLAGKPEGHDGPVIFARDGLAALGYHLETEGMQFSANLNMFHERLPDALNEDVLWTHLWWNTYRVRLMDTLAGLRVSDGFTIERFVDLTVSALSVAGFRPDAAERFDLASVLDDFPRHLTAARDRFRPLRDSLFGPLVELAGRDEVRGEVSAAVQALLDDTTLESALEDVYVHTLEHALGNACRITGGVESQSRLTGWAELRADVGTGTGRITIFELGTGGIGIMRAVQRAFAAHPELFWRVVSAQATTCEVHDGEAFVRAVLRLPESELVWLDDAVRELTFASDAVRAEQLQRDIASFIRRNLGALMTPAQSRLLTRVFAEPLSTGAGDIASWRLYREINVTRWDALVAELGREPSTGEARHGIAWQIVCDAESGADNDSELVRLYHAMRPLGSLAPASATADDGDDELAVEAGVAGLSRQIAQRLLASCTDVCVACLVDQSCTLADRQRSPLMLSRRLASAILRGSTPAVLDARGRDRDTLVADLRSQLSMHGRVRVRYTASDASAVDAGLLGLIDVSFIPSSAGQESFVRPVSAWFALADARGAQPVHELELEVWQHIDAGVAEPSIDPLALRRAASTWELFLFQELHLARFDETAELLIAVPQLNGPAAVDADHDDAAGAGRIPQLAFSGYAQPRPHQPWTFEDVLGSLLQSRARLHLLLPRDAVDSDDLIERIDVLTREAGSRLVVRFTNDPLSVGTIVGRGAVLRFSTNTLPSVSIDPEEVAGLRDQLSMLFAQAFTRAEAVRGAR